MNRTRQPSLPTPRQQLAARPLRRPDVTCTPTDSGAQLSVAVQPARWAGWLLRVRSGERKRYDLDALGVFVWEQCDGHTSVRRIARRLSRAFKLTDRDAHVATAAFLQTLAGKGLVAVVLPGKNKRGCENK